MIRTGESVGWALFIGSPLVLLVVCVLIWSVDVTPYLGIALASSSLLWQLRTWLESTREVVATRVRMHDPAMEMHPFGGEKLPVLFVEVVNHGRLPIYLRSVVLRRRKNRREPNPSIGPPLGAYVELEFRPQSDAKAPLNVGEARGFLISEVGSEAIQKFLDAWRFWLVVITDRGVVSCKSARDLRPLLAHLRDRNTPRENRMREEMATLNRLTQKQLSEFDSRLYESKDPE